LRARYKDEYAPDIIQKAMKAPLFVFDELEELTGARDELPAILDVLDHRHGNRLPTVITSNLDWPNLGDVIGPRMKDRLSQSAFEGGALSFAGESMRKQMRGKYFNA
jgi:DNA replication protein DnaC